MRAKPLLTSGLVAGALALPGSALSLGLGKLTVDSALGQPLSARIELTSATKDELDTLSARVADPGLYRQNNLTYQGALARTRISLENQNGASYLRVSSPVSVQEPFLDLLVELNWAAGRVVREYTFLLDPPGTGQTAVATTEPITPARTGATTRPAAPAAPVAAAPAPAPAAGSEGTYTVKRGDTLSKIAGQVKPAEITLDQMLVAMFRANENAFDGRNMNRLRTGMILTVPSATDAAATEPSEATKLVQVQAADWRAYRDRVAANAPASEGAGGREAGGRIGTAVTESTPAAAPGSDRVRVSREGRVGKGGAGEDAVARSNELREAKERIAELEKMVAEMQRTLQLRSGTMAQLQNQAEAQKSTPAAATPTAPISTPPAAVSPAPPAAKAAEPAKVPEPVIEPVKAPPTAETKAAEKAPEPAKEPSEPVAAMPAPATPAPSTVAEPTASAPDATKTVATDKGTPPKAAVKKPAKESPGFLDDLVSNVPGWALGGGALVVIAGIAALFAARRRKTTKFEDSIISGTDIKTNTVFGSTGGGVVNTGDNSLASDFSREGLGNIDTDEVDPIAEAEVYLAYGRDAQAEEILKDALKKDPQRQEIYLKLLEIHAQHNKPSAFETVASELYAVSQGQGEVWQKAVALGRQLDPNNPIFGEGGAPVPHEARAVEPTLAPPMPERSPEPVAQSDRPLDNIIDEEISISPTSGGKSSKSAAEILAGAEDVLERSVKPLPVASAERSHSAVEAAGAATAALAGALAASKAAFEAKHVERTEPAKDAPKFDLDFHLDDDEKPAPMKPHAPAREPVLAEAVGAAPAQLARPAAALELDKLDLSFDPERSTFEDPTPSVLDGQWHDAATKLDLAKAYQEMGDLEGAREILQEVLHEGDDQQKSEAQALLGKLG
ncbi:MAG TPA: FimV/HubP family polar landmark protein [Casimicrobiaceae bacterium]